MKKRSSNEKNGIIKQNGNDSSYRDGTHSLAGCNIGKKV